MQVCMMGCAPATEVGLIVGAPLGILIGGAVGATIRSDRWRPVKAADAGLQIVRTRGGIGLGVAVGF